MTKNTEMLELNLSRIAIALEHFARAVEQLANPVLAVEKPDPCQYGHIWRIGHTIGVRTSAKPFCSRCGLETHS